MKKQPWWARLAFWLVLLPVFYVLAAYDWIRQQLRGEA